MMFAYDIVLCGGREVDMTEYLDTWRKSLEEIGMRVSRPKTREPVNIPGEELEIVTHFKYLGTSMEYECDIVEAPWLGGIMPDSGSREPGFVSSTYDGAVDGDTLWRQQNKILVIVLGNKL